LLGGRTRQADVRHRVRHVEDRVAPPLAERPAPLIEGVRHVLRRMNEHVHGHGVRQTLQSGENHRVRVRSTGENDALDAVGNFRMLRLVDA